VTPQCPDVSARAVTVRIVLVLQEVLAPRTGACRSFLLGTGTGSFGAKTDFDTGSSPISVAVGDFNGDGKLDLAVANHISNNVSILLNTTPPPITAAGPLSRQQGSAASNSTIATVNGTESGAGGVTVTATIVPAGISVTSIVNTAGTVTADVAAGCTAATGNNTVVLTATDGCGATATATLTVNVTANTAPTLTYANQSIVFNGSLNINPSTIRQRECVFHRPAIAGDLHRNDQR